MSDFVKTKERILAFTEVPEGPLTSQSLIKEVPEGPARLARH